MQVRHPYEYSEHRGNAKSGWRFSGKKLSRDWVYVWAVKNPRTGKMALVMSNDASGAPTRVEPVETWYNRDLLSRLQGNIDDDVADPPDDGEKWRLMCRLVDSGQVRITETNYGLINSARLNVLMEQLVDD